MLLDLRARLVVGLLDAGGVDAAVLEQPLQGADVATLAADDPALQLVRLELDHGDGGLDGMAARHPLHDSREDVPGAAVGVPLRLLLDLTDQPRALVAELVLELAEQDLLRLRCAEPRQPLELPKLFAPGLLQLVAVLLQVPLPV